MNSKLFPCRKFSEVGLIHSKIFPWISSIERAFLLWKLFRFQSPFCGLNNDSKVSLVRWIAAMNNELQNNISHSIITMNSISHKCEHVSTSYITNHVREQQKIARPLFLLNRLLITIASHVNYIFFFLRLSSYVNSQLSVMFCLSFLIFFLIKTYQNLLIDWKRRGIINPTRLTKSLARNELSARDHYACLWWSFFQLTSLKKFAFMQGRSWDEIGFMNFQQRF